MTVLLLLFACRQEITTIDDHNSRREQEFFRNNANPASRNFGQIAGHITNLREINSKTEFISKLSDKAGLPKWGFSMTTAIGTPGKSGRTGDADVLIIPMQEDDDSYLSSLLYVERPESDNPIIYTVTNLELYDFVHNSNINAEIREQILSTFLYFDKEVYDNKDFAHLPADLYAEMPLKEGETSKSFMITSTESTDPQGLHYNTICVVNNHCTRTYVCDYGSNCDHCLKECESVNCYTAGGGGYEGPGTDGPGDTGNPGEGNGGGTGSGECNRGGWYRIIPPNGCGGGGDVETPCQNINNKQKDTKYAEKYNALNQSNIFSMNRERGFFERQSPPSNNLGSTFIQLDGPEGSSGLGLPDNISGIVGLLHSHNDENGVIKIFSPTDVRTFINHFLPQANSYLGSYGQAYTTVVTSFGSYTLQFTEGTHPGGINYNTWEQWNTWYKEKYEQLIKNENLTKANVEKVFTQFLKEVVNINGLEVYRVTKNTAVRLEYNGKDNPVKETPCPVITP